MSIKHWLLASPIFALATLTGPVAAQSNQKQYIVVYVEFLPAKTVQGGLKLQQLAGLAKAAPGEIHFDVNQEIQRSNFYSLVEIWKDAASYQAFVSSRRTQTLINAIEPLLEAPFDQRPGTFVK